MHEIQTTHVLFNLESISLKEGVQNPSHNESPSLPSCQVCCWTPEAKTSVQFGLLCQMSSEGALSQAGGAVVENPQQ